MTAARHPDAIVVGAGIVGAACAWFLARKKFLVRVLESRFAGGGVTAAGMGHIVVMDDSEAQFSLTSRSCSLWTEAAPDLALNCEDDPCGTLWIAADDAEISAVRAKADFYRRRDVKAEILDSRELGQAEPNLRCGLAGALFVPGDRVLYPPNAARWLLQRARDHGAELCEAAQVSEISGRHVVCEGERMEAGAIVNAAGPEAASLTPGLPIEPRKGHLVITDRYPGFCRHELVELDYLKSAHGSAGPSVAFNLQPRRTGQMLLGSSREFVGWDSSVNPTTVQAMVERAVAFMPKLSGLSAIRTWTGFRPATPDKLPLIGQWRDDGPWIAAGHEGLGITTSLATGELLADLMSGTETHLDPVPFDPNRKMAEGRT